MHPGIDGVRGSAAAARASSAKAAANLNLSRSNVYRAVHSPVVSQAQAIAASDPGMPADKPTRGKATK